MVSSSSSMASSTAFLVTLIISLLSSRPTMASSANFSQLLQPYWAPDHIISQHNQIKLLLDADSGTAEKHQIRITRGNFTTITQAIDVGPLHNDRRVIISIKPGVYREKIVTFLGEYDGQPSTTWNDIPGSTYRSATVAVNAVAIILLKVYGRKLKLVGLLILSSLELVASQQSSTDTDPPSSPTRRNFELALSLIGVFGVILVTAYWCWRARSDQQGEATNSNVGRADIEMAPVAGEEEECPICFEDMRDEQSAHPLPQCNDKFHDHCILQWSLRSGSNACPICCRTPP